MNTSNVKRPWPLFLMALWSFFGIGSFLSSLNQTLFSENETLLQLAFIATIGATIALMYFLVKFNRNALIVFAVLSFALAAFQIFNVITILLTNGFNPIVYFLLYYIIPSFALGWLAFTKKYSSSAKKYTEYEKQEAMRKTTIKAMRR